MPGQASVAATRERLILIVAGLLMIQPGIVTDGIGLAIFILIIFGQWKRRPHLVTD